MPIAEPTVLDLRQYSLRHVGPKAAVFPDTPAPQFTVLARTDMVARPLPQANIPNSADFVQGKWTGRLYDAGDGQLTWPNKEASDGAPWRQRFAPDGKLQWLEIYLDEYLEQNLCITKVTPDRNQVVVEGYDGFQLCKSAYERDWTVVKAPRDVIERGTQLWVPTIVDDFPAGSLNAQWTIGGGAPTIGTSGGLVLTTSGALGNDSEVVSSTVTVAGNVWRSFASIGYAAVTSTNFLASFVSTSTVQYALRLYNGFAQFFSGVILVAQLQIPTAATYSFLLEGDGEWVWAYVNGQLVGVVRAAETSAGHLITTLGLFGGGGGVAATATITSVFTEALQPFLQRGTDKGDYVLPGGASTYPNGGLHARYYNDLDLQSDGHVLLKVLAPSRSQAYAGSGSAEYANQQDTGIVGQNSPKPGAADIWWSVKWFGAIYLKLSQGDYTCNIGYGGASTWQGAVRVWIGKTNWGDQLVDQWAYTTNFSYNFTISASALSGSLPYGGGTVARDGWYPIVIEYAVNSPGAGSPTLKFTPPVSYVDPGGTALTSGVQVTVPATSLSPEGCWDQRHQGISHYELVQKTAIAVGYQFAIEPKQLESGLFPGVLAPRIREGSDYDLLIEPDDTQRKEGMLNYSALSDGTDQCSSLQGNGAGFQNGNSGQLQGFVFDPPTLRGALFDMQGWQDAADAAFLSTLESVLGSELGLRLSPWSLVAGDPVGRERLANTWPLPGSLQQFRWRPGDGARIYARDLNIQDTSPRQMLEVTRNIHPNGATSTQVGFAGRPKTNTFAIRRALGAAMRPQRNYQRQLISIASEFISGVVAAGATGTFCHLPVMPSDQLVSVVFRLTTNTAGVSWGINDTFGDRTSVLGGPWTGPPNNGSAIQVDIKSIAVQSATDWGRQIFAVINKGGVASDLEYVVIATVLR